MKKITVFVLCVFSMGICTAQISSSYYANGGKGSPLLAEGISNTTKGIGQYLGLNTIHNGYGRFGNRRSYTNGILKVFESIRFPWRTARISTNFGSGPLISARYNPLTDEIEVKAVSYTHLTLPTSDLV